MNYVSWNSNAFYISFDIVRDESSLPLAYFCILIWDPQYRVSVKNFNRRCLSYFDVVFAIEIKFYCLYI